MQLLRTGKARTVVFILALFLTSYYCAVRLIHGADTCESLLQDGHYRDLHTWQPDDCAMHNYTEKQLRSCMKHPQFIGQHNKVAFVGDSRVQYIYSAFRKLFGKTTNVVVNCYDKEFIEPQLNLRVQFFWRPFVNDTFEKVFLDWRADNQSLNVPKLIVADNALHTIKFSNDSEQTLIDYQRNLTRVGAIMDHLSGEGSQVLWLVQAPSIHSRLIPRQQLMTNQNLDKYNAAARRALSGTGVHFWESYRLMGEGLLDEYVDSIHVGPYSNRNAAQLLVNVLCNNRMNFSDGTCCKTFVSSTVIILLTLAGFLIVFSVLMVVRCAQLR